MKPPEEIGGPLRDFSLSALDGVRLGAFTLSLAGVRALRRSGWRGFSLHLRDERGVPGAPPVLEGIHSRGGKDGVKGWMDLDYREEIRFENGGTAGPRVSLRAAALDRRIFRLLGEAIPAGGHLMISYEGDQEIHAETLSELLRGVPPAATPLGCLLFFGGFRYVKDWYLAEGGMEGPRKLWGEKAPDDGWERTFEGWTARELHPFLEQRPLHGAGDPLEAARGRAEEILRSIREGGP